jgi:hypothetical protein
MHTLFQNLKREITVNTITNDQTPIKYFKEELKHVLQKGIDSHKTSAYSPYFDRLDTFSC